MFLGPCSMEYAAKLVTLAEVVLVARKETLRRVMGEVRLGRTKEGKTSSILPTCRIRCGRLLAKTTYDRFDEEACLHEQVRR